MSLSNALIASSEFVSGWGTSSARGWRWLEPNPGCCGAGEAMPGGVRALDGPGTLGDTPGLVCPVDGRCGWIGTGVVDGEVPLPALPVAAVPPPVLPPVPCANASAPNTTAAATPAINSARMVSS